MTLRDLVWDVRRYSRAARAYLSIRAGMPEAPNYDQDTFRARTNVVDPSGVDAAFDAGDAAAGADWTQDVDTLFRVRWLIQQTVSNAGNHANLTTPFLLQFRVNGGTWTAVGAEDVGGVAVEFDSCTGFAEGDNTTTARLGSGSLVTGDGLENANTSDEITFTEEALSEVELEVSLKIIGSEVNDEDTIELRWLYSNDDESPPATVLESYTDTPSITVNKVTATNIAPTPVTAAYGIVAPGITLGAIDVMPTAVAAAWGVPAPGLTLGAVNVAPTPVTAAYGVPAPGITLGAVNIVPTPVTAAYGIPVPSISTAADIRPTPVTAAWSTPTAGLTLGAVDLTAAPVTAAYSIPVSSITLGAIDIMPTPVSAAYATVAPAITLGGVAVAPTPVTAAYGVPTHAMTLGAIDVDPTPVVATWSIPAPMVEGGGAPPDDDDTELGYINRKQHLHLLARRRRF